MVIKYRGDGGSNVINQLPPDDTNLPSALVTDAPAVATTLLGLSSTASSTATTSSPSSFLITEFVPSHTLSSPAGATSGAALATAAASKSSSASTVETRKIVIGVVTAVVISILLITISLAYLCIKRKRVRRQKETATAHQDSNRTDGEADDSQLYFQQKVELDDEQRIHEMEAVETRYELRGDDEIREMPVEEREMIGGRQDLRGEEHSKEPDYAL